VSSEVDALERAYTDLGALAESLDEPASWRQTGCAGWAVRDLIFHLLGDAQRALVAFGTPAGAVAADRDAVTYWTDSPGREDPDSRNLRGTRTMASAWRLDFLIATYVETAKAVLTASRRLAPADLVVTQGHVLTVRDLVATLVVEATVHHLDLVVGLDYPGPAPLPLSFVRSALDGLLGHPSPPAWDDASWARLGSGRRSPTELERRELGPNLARLPLLH
jgi:uncharacterized protein (TIGR03083 family)